jgi:hypothetical protein
MLRVAGWHQERQSAQWGRGGRRGKDKKIVHEAEHVRAGLADREYDVDATMCESSQNVNHLSSACRVERCTETR